MYYTQIHLEFSKTSFILSLPNDQKSALLYRFLFFLNNNTQKIHKKVNLDH